MTRDYWITCLKMVNDNCHTGLHTSPLCLTSLSHSVWLLSSREAACRGSKPEPRPSAGLKKPGGPINFNSKRVAGLLCLGPRLGCVCVFLEAGCVYMQEVFSSDISLPQGPATLICSAITQISHPRQITDLLLVHTDLPGPPPHLW